MYLCLLKGLEHEVVTAIASERMDVGGKTAREGRIEVAVRETGVPSALSKVRPEQSSLHLIFAI